MYTNGLNPKIKELYPKITFPVSRGTPSIYDLPFWDHTEMWTDGLNDFVSKTLMEQTNKIIIYSRIYKQYSLILFLILLTCYEGTYFIAFIVIYYIH